MATVGVKGIFRRNFADRYLSYNCLT